MNLRTAFVSSCLVHAPLALVILFATTSEPLEAEVVGWEQEEIRPVVLKVITMPASEPAPAEPEAQELAQAPAVEQNPGDIKPTPKKKIQRRPRTKVTPKPSVEPAPAPPVEAPEVVSVVASKAQDAPVVAKVADATAGDLVPGQQLTVARVSSPARAVPAAYTAPAAPAAPMLSKSARRGLSVGYKRSIYRFVNARANAKGSELIRRMRLKGRVIVVVTINAQGQILKSRVKRSSGHDVLDREAIKTIRSLKSLPQPPQSLGWTTKTIAIPMVYK